MTTRRGFLELGAKVAAAGYALRGAGAFAAMAEGVSGMTYGVQMFEVRKQALTDLPGAFKAIKDAGFDQVELYPIAYHQPAGELKKMLGDAGLQSVSGHFDFDQRKMSIEYAHNLGLKYIVCPWLPGAPAVAPETYRKAVDQFNGWGEEAKAAGMQFAFHNHCYEFKPVGGTNGWTVLMNGADAKLVKLEFDVFWLKTGGQDPAEMLRKYADRAVLIHMKDQVAGAPQTYVVDDKATSYCTELGTGTMDWPGLLKQARAQGIQYAFLDQDDTKIPVNESMKASREYLQKISA